MEIGYFNLESIHEKEKRGQAGVVGRLDKNYDIESFSIEKKAINLIVHGFDREGKLLSDGVLLPGVVEPRKRVVED